MHLATREGSVIVGLKEIDASQADISIGTAHACSSSSRHALAGQNLCKRLAFLGREIHVDRFGVEKMRPRVRALAGEVGFTARHDHSVIGEEIGLEWFA